MRFPKSKTNSYFGIFTFNCSEKPNLVWKGSIQETRIEVSPVDNQEYNRMGIMFIYGRREMKPNDVSLCEIVPLSQDLMNDVNKGEILTVKHGSTLLGEFKLLYIGGSTI